MSAAGLRARFWAALPAALEAAGEVGVTVDLPAKQGRPGFVRAADGLSRHVALGHVRGSLWARCGDEKCTQWGDPETAAREMGGLLRCSLEASRRGRVAVERDKASRALARDLTAAAGTLPNGHPAIEFASTHLEPGRYWIDASRLRFDEEQGRGLIAHLRATGVLPGVP